MTTSIDSTGMHPWREQLFERASSYRWADGLVCQDATTCTVVALDRQGKVLRSDMAWMDLRAMERGMWSRNLSSTGVWDDY